MAAILKPLNELFLPIEPFTSVDQAQRAAQQINKFLGVEKTIDFLQKFDLNGFQIKEQVLHDVCFIDIKILYCGMFGKYPPFN